jgi:drug/metabolite transporter (DMT)-like permease
LRTAHLALLSVSLIYAVNVFISKFVFLSVPHFGILAIRSLSAWLFFIPIAVFKIKEKIQSREDYLRLIFCGITGVAINQFFYLWGLSKTSPVNTSVLMITSPVFVFLLCWLGKSNTETFNTQRILGLILSFVGSVFLITNGKSLSLNEEGMVGDIMIIINAIAYAIYLVAVKPLVNKYDMFTLFAWIFGIGGTINIAIGMNDLVNTNWSNISLLTYLGIAFIAFFTTIIAYSWNGWAMRRLPASYVGMYIYLQPIITTLFSFYWASNTLSWVKIGWILCILMGVFMTTTQINFLRKKEIRNEK